VIVADRVSYWYRRGVPIVSDWSGSFEAGTMTALTGPSGRGKSTLLYVLGAMLRPSRGQVCLDGQDVSRLSDRARSKVRAQTVGFLFQDAQLDQRRSVMANVLEGAVYRGMRRDTAEAKRLLDSLGVNVEPARRATALSGGQAQRIALCRALLGRPPIILADEPTGNLDPQNAQVVEGALRAHAVAGACVVIVTHDLALAARCDVEHAL
jgi:ABC-type lipoprotein export system ATPase subunit